MTSRPATRRPDGAPRRPARPRAFAAALRRLALAAALTVAAACAPFQAEIRLSAEDLAAAAGERRSLPARLTVPKLRGREARLFGPALAAHFEVETVGVAPAAETAAEAALLGLLGPQAAPTQVPAPVDWTALAPEARYRLEIALSLPLADHAEALAGDAAGLLLVPDPAPPAWAAGATHRLSLAEGGRADAFRTALRDAIVAANAAEAAAGLAEAEGTAAVRMPGRLLDLTLEIAGESPVEMVLPGARIGDARHWVWRGRLAPGARATLEIRHTHDFDLPEAGWVRLP